MNEEITTYDPTTEITNCCGAAITGTTEGICCKKCWRIAVREQGKNIEALVKLWMTTEEN